MKVHGKAYVTRDSNGPAPSTILATVRVDRDAEIQDGEAVLELTPLQALNLANDLLDQATGQISFAVEDAEYYANRATAVPHDRIHKIGRYLRRLVA